MATDTTKPVAPELLPEGKWTTNPRVTMATSLGNVVFELLPNAAPFTVVNFLAYVNTGFYTNLLFHRVIPNFVVQGGGYFNGQVQKLPFYDPIGLESNNGLKNVRGTLAMARTDNPNSATSQFFVNLTNNIALNFTNLNNPGYAVFGKVIAGMSVIDNISKVATADRGGFTDVPVKNVVIGATTEATTGTIHNKNLNVLVGGIEFGATWQYSADRGKHWTTGTKTGSTAYTFKLLEGTYEADVILVRQLDKAGNVSAVGKTGASVVAFAGTAILGDANANVLHGTSGNDNLFGLAGNDSLTAGNGNDRLDGGSGKDLMTGGNGNDTYFVRDSSDIVRETSAAGGTDIVKSLVSAYTLARFVENGQIMSADNANLTGNVLDNTLVAGVGNNTLNGGAGLDTVSYASGISGSKGVNVNLAITTLQATGGSGNDKLISIENLFGSAFADRLTGNHDQNILSGGAGADRLTGGGGSDRLFGGAGRDIFDFDALTDLGKTVATSDTVRDFTAGDLLDLSGLDAKTTTALNDAFSTTLVTDFTAAGQLKFENGVLYGNTDGDFSNAEFVVSLTGVTSLGAWDLVV